MGESPELDDPALAVLSRLAVHSRSSTESFAFMAVNWFNDFSIHFRPVTRRRELDRMLAEVEAANKKK
jgi:hypothetical protein